MIEIVRGDDNKVTAQLKRDGVIRGVDSGATVRAAFIHSDTDQAFGPVTCDSGAPDADWASGVIIIKFPSTLSETFALGLGYIEIEVDDGEKETFFLQNVSCKQEHII